MIPPTCPQHEAACRPPSRTTGYRSAHFPARRMAHLPHGRDHQQPVWSDPSGNRADRAERVQAADDRVRPVRTDVRSAQPAARGRTALLVSHRTGDLDSARGEPATGLRAAGQADRARRADVADDVSDFVPLYVRDVCDTAFRPASGRGPIDCSECGGASTAAIAGRCAGEYISSLCLTSRHRPSVRRRRRIRPASAPPRRGSLKDTPLQVVGAKQVIVRDQELRAPQEQEAALGQGEVEAAQDGDWASAVKHMSVLRHRSRSTRRKATLARLGHAGATEGQAGAARAVFAWASDGPWPSSVEASWTAPPRCTPKHARCLLAEDQCVSTDAGIAQTSDHDHAPRV